MKRNFVTLVFTLGIFLFAGQSLLFGQIQQMDMANRNLIGRSVNYYYAKPGDITITVSLWGFVNKPGLYEVSSSTDLVSLISLAGGPTNYAKLSDVRIIRTFKAQNGDTVKKEIKVNLENIIELNQEQLQLRPGDVIYVNHTYWYSIREAFSITSSIALLFSAAYYLTRIF